MTFRQYVGIKEKIIKESINLGIVTRTGMLETFTVQREAHEAVFDFMVEQDSLVLHPENEEE
jgi:hypothetical protein